MSASDLKGVMATLKAKGKPNTVAIYRRHGIVGDVYGVSFGDLNALAKTFKRDHPLGVALWATGNFDARTLATLVADPKALTPSEADAWVNAIGEVGLADYFVTQLIAKTPFAAECVSKWTRSPKEYVRRCGYMLMSWLAQKSDALSDATFEAALPTIAAEIHASPNRAREAMIGCVVGIGMRSPELRAKALAVAQRIGPVDIDHGDTACKTLDAVASLAGTYADKGMRSSSRAREPKSAKAAIAR